MVPCPKAICRGGVEVNRRGYWECHTCHTQFTTTPTLKQTVDVPPGVHFPLLRFSITKEEPALELVEKGIGEF